ncbi:hypothetical protein [Sphingomonas aerolata]|uniref:hypothetical protein n=1 Tax=Sphingomonas aerolata TaxID=185951 RepID=UPI002FE1BB84
MAIDPIVHGCVSCRAFSIDLFAAPVVISPQPFSDPTFWAVIVYHDRNDNGLVYIDPKSAPHEGDSVAFKRVRRWLRPSRGCD